MTHSQLGNLKFFSLLLLLPGLAGLIFSAMISTQYLNTLPSAPDPQEMRMVPRSVHGNVVYQTKEEDRQLSMIEDISVSIFVVGMVLGILYLEKWSVMRAQAAEEDDDWAENHG
jgi:hypothetical protein